MAIKYQLVNFDCPNKYNKIRTVHEIPTKLSSSESSQQTGVFLHSSSIAIARTGIWSH